MVYFLTKASSDIIKIAAKSNTLQRVCTMSTQTPKELRIPVPWGHIAAKEWGPADGTTRLLGLHGWQDNSSTFDGLAPLLPPNTRFVALDFAGHGQSSFLPPGSFYHIVDFVPTVRRVADYLGWSEFSIIGHSMGAGIAVLFGSINPSRIHKIICLDGLIPIPTKAQSQPDFTAVGIDQMIKLEQNESEVPAYTFEEAVKRYVNALSGKILESSARTLMLRGTNRLDETMVQYSRDRRLLVKSLLGFTPEQVKSFVSKFQKEILIILVKDGMFDNANVTNEILQVFKQNASKFVYRRVEGHHHVHLDHPDRVAKIVCEFLEDEHGNYVYNL